MASLGEIRKIVSVADGPNPQMGPISTIPLQLEVLTVGGLAFLQISQSAAVELVEELSKRLRVRGCL